MFPAWKDACDFCGDKNEGEDKDEPHYRLECPECCREGCHACMPMGRGCVCPECEDMAAKEP